MRLLTSFANTASTSHCELNGQPIDCGELADKAAPFLGIGVVILIIFVVLTLLSLVFWLWMLIHAIQHNSPDRTVWIAVLAGSFFFGLPFIAAVVYFLAEKKSAEQAPTASPAGTPTPPINNSHQ